MQIKICWKIKSTERGWAGYAGCLLGKTVEGIKTDELIPFLKETENYPMHRYILYSDLNDVILNKYKYRFANRCYADKIDGMAGRRRHELCCTCTKNN